MACRKAYRKAEEFKVTEEATVLSSVSATAEPEVERLLFGADSEFESKDLLQNNITLFEWIVRNKIYPNFLGRYISGENKLTKDEVTFLHSKGCKVAAIYKEDGAKETEEAGQLLAKKAVAAATELSIPAGCAIFLELGDEEVATTAFMKGFAEVLEMEGYTPAFKANTDAEYGFDREFGRGVQNEKEIFSKCLIWAVAPTVKEYDSMTTSHFIHPDEWKPFAPSGMKRRDIAIWQYGKKCHPIEDDAGKDTTFNLDLVLRESVIIEKMF